LSNHRHEHYAISRAAGYSQTESAKRAGFPTTSAPNAGHRLEKQEGVKRRVAELSASDKKDEGIASRPWIISNLVEIVRVGLHPGSRDLSNANRALESLAKLGGHVVERRQTYSEKVRVTGLSSSELHELLKDQLAALPGPDRQKLLAMAPSIFDPPK